MENGEMKKEDEVTKVESGPVEIEVEPVKIEVEPVKTEAEHVNTETVSDANVVKIENGKNKMKIKCIKCKLVDSLTEEDVKLLAHIVKRYNHKPSPNDYTAVLSVIKGNCTDNKKHLFIFDESFDKDVANILKEYKDAIAANVARKETLEKVCIMMAETTNQIRSLESTLKDLKKRKEYTISEMSTGGILIDNIKLKFERLTGTSDTSTWS